MAAHIYLEFTIKMCKRINIWPTENRTFCLTTVREWYILAITCLSTILLACEFVVQFYENNYTFTSLDTLIAVSALLSVIYISLCFMLKKHEIKALVEGLDIFEKYCPEQLIEETEKTATFYSKVFIIYGIVGNMCYSILPILEKNSCNKHKSIHMEKWGIPCGVVGKYILPFKYDFSPLTEIVILQEFVVCVLGTTTVMTVTMLLCGILTHIAANLTHLKRNLLDIANVDGDALTSHVNYCIKYHTVITDFSTRTTNAFSVTMLVHITWTSFIISVLGFEMIVETNYSSSLRFGMHLAGWMGMLFLVCFYGQILMDKSLDISKAVYDSKWYEKPPKIRLSLMLILLRSQRPLTLKAAGLKVMSLATFLGVMSSAYSYFTLLLKLRQ